VWKNGGVNMFLGNGDRTQFKWSLQKPLILLAWCIIVSTQAIAQDCSVDQIDLRGSFGQVRFEILIADTQKSRAKGLMNVSKLAPREGMLFVYPAPERVSFWMRSTLIPLDMLFADGRGEIVRVHKNARPHDETPIFGGDNVQFVLEINAGLSKRYGIHVGAQMRHPFITDKASWACK
jgi:uncharacterized protein